MLRGRLIPALLIHKRGFVKTKKFRNPVYVGDPINTIKIFNQKEVDEIVIYDIDATVENREPNYKFIMDIVGEAFIPVCYGGGVKRIQEMERLFRLGVEKVSISHQAVYNPHFVKDACRIFGSQAIVVTLDYKSKIFKKEGKIVYTHNGRKCSGITVLEMVKKLTDYGVGEIILNSISKDGTKEGYDFEFIKKISDKIKIPLVALGGARDLLDMKNVIKYYGASAAAAGSLFVFYGKRNAVLINYPAEEEINALFQADKQ